MCDSEFQMDAGIDSGHYVPQYQNLCLYACWKGNWDGWASHYEGKLIAHLNQKGIPIPARNAKGWLPRSP